MRNPNQLMGRKLGFIRRIIQENKPGINKSKVVLGIQRVGYYKSKKELGPIRRRNTWKLGLKWNSRIINKHIPKILRINESPNKSAKKKQVYTRMRSQYANPGTIR